MGIDISAKLMAGLEYKDIEPWIKEQSELLECDESEVIDRYFDYASPWYDSDMEYWFIGIECRNYDSLESMSESIKAAADKFYILTSLTPVINATPHVY